MNRLLDILLVRFAIVGVTIAAIYVLGYLLFVQLGLPRFWANGMAFAVAVTSQYVGQTVFTFRRKLGEIDQVFRFGVMIGAGFVTSALITSWAAPLFGAPDALAATVVAFVLPVQNFILMKLWVYAKPLTCESAQDV